MVTVIINMFTDASCKIVIDRNSIIWPLAGWRLTWRESHCCIDNTSGIDSARSGQHVCARGNKASWGPSRTSCYLGSADTDRASLLGHALNNSQPLLERASQGKIKPVAIEMSSNEDIVVPVLWEWLLVDAGNKGKWCMHPLNQQSSYSVSQSPWKAKRSSASQEIPCVVWNPKVHYHIHKSLLLVLEPGQSSQCTSSLLLEGTF